LWLLTQVVKHRGGSEPWSALVLLPTNTIFDDFASRLHGWAEKLHQRVRIIQYPSRLDREERRRVRKGCAEADVIVMTPDMWLKTLVSNYLRGEAKGGDYAQWAKKLLESDAVVVEEVDALGERTVMRLRFVLQILRERCRQQSNRSFQTVVTSATIPNGKEVAEALLEEGVVVEGGGRRGEVHVWVRPRRIHREEDALDVLLKDLLASDREHAQQFGVFWENKQGLERLAQRLRFADYNVFILTSESPKEYNQQITQGFKEKHIRGIGFTSISSRGLNVAGFRTLVIVGLPPRLVELFQALGRVARNPGEKGFVYHLLDANDPQQRDFLKNPDRLQKLYGQGGVALRFPKPSIGDVEQALAIALTLGVRQRNLLDNWFGPSTQRALLQHRVAGHLAYTASEYIPGPEIDELVYEQGLRQMGKRLTVLTGEGKVVGCLDLNRGVQHAFVGALLLLGQQVLRVLSMGQDNVVVESVPAELVPYYMANRVAGDLTFSVRARRTFGPVTLALVGVQRFGHPVAWELRESATDSPLARGKIPTVQQMTVAQQGDGLYIEEAGTPYPLPTLQLLMATLIADVLEAPRVAIEESVVGGRLLLAERVGGCGVLEPFFEHFHDYLNTAYNRLQQMDVETWRQWLLPALQSNRVLTEENRRDVLELFEVMLNGREARS